MGRTVTRPAGEERATAESVVNALRHVYEPDEGLDLVSAGLVSDLKIYPDGTLWVVVRLRSGHCLDCEAAVWVQVHLMCATVPGVTRLRVDLLRAAPSVRE
jgi:metal-sulfur cluster biosynthetic enzyme